MSIRIALAEDNDLFRNGIAAVLKRVRDFELCIVLSNGMELLDAMESCPVDIVLTDILMPVMGGIEVAEHVSRRYPNVRVMAITMFEEEYYLQKMLEAGVRGYVIKDIKAGILEEAVRAVYEGKSFYSEEVLSLLAKNLIKKDSESVSVEKLSKRETEVVRLIAQGLSSDRIGLELNISVKTVSNHRNNIYSKLNVQNTAELVSFAYKNKIIKVE